MVTFQRGPAPASAGQYLGLGVSAVVLGFAGLGFLFVPPIGAGLSAVGLLCGIVGWLLARSYQRAGFWWSVWGTILCFVALASNIGIIKYGTFSHWFDAFTFWLPF